MKKVFKFWGIIAVTAATMLSITGCAADPNINRGGWSEYTSPPPNRNYVVVGTVVIRDGRRSTLLADLMEKAMKMGAHDITYIRVGEASGLFRTRIHTATALAIRYVDETHEAEQGSLLVEVTYHVGAVQGTLDEKVAWHVEAAREALAAEVAMHVEAALGAMAAAAQDNPANAGEKAVDKSPVIIGRMPAPNEQGSYRVQVGSFPSLVLAKPSLDQLMFAGFSPETEWFLRPPMYLRVFISSVRASEMPEVIQRVGNLGFEEIWIHREDN